MSEPGVERMRAVLLVCALLLAGCSDGSSVTEAAEAPDVAPTPESGSIVGVVVDETIVPVAGAKVTTGDQEVTSDQDGRFVFNGLLPAVHIIGVTGDGFLPAQAEAVVRSDEITELRVVVRSDGRVAPYRSSQAFDGFMQAQVGPVSSILVAVAPEAASCTCTFDVTPDPGAWTFVLEAFGEPSLGSNPAGAGDVFWEWLAVDNPDTEEDETRATGDHGTYPVLAHVPAAAFAPTTSTYQTRLTGGNLIHLEESYELVVTTFYHEPAPSGWSFTQ